MPAAKRKVVVTLDTYLSVLAVVSSFCAIGITFYQAYLQRTQQYASVMPVLDSYNTSRLLDGTHGYAILIANNGLGPAFIEKVSFRYKDKRYNFINELKDAVINDEDSTAVTSDLWQGRVIPQGEKLEIIESHSRKTESLFREGLSNRDIEIEILYRSVYGEIWKLRFPDGRNAKVE
jgi:hypothetical protein